MKTWLFFCYRNSRGCCCCWCCHCGRCRGCCHCSCGCCCRSGGWCCCCVFWGNHNGFHVSENVIESVFTSVIRRPLFPSFTTISVHNTSLIPIMPWCWSSLFRTLCAKKDRDKESVLSLVRIWHFCLEVSK